ncbi:response regulator transcription factor [Azohydromonas caseinilytica]|uniref:Response regulator transcription factor n=1 Tax=Azohydromonas caseinilytica TaxID=2728836 RepID=A0A848F2Y5_9BURK|nr:response regulator transcription factor [Azohydromonas caseinilytica]NML13762.1 response regulator transcription factor [Azohydromonas caseinilytica]
MIRALLCDAHPLVRQALRQVLAEAGIDTAAEAPDGAEVLRLVLAAEQPFDVVLMDIEMPYRDGLDLLRRLRSECPRLPVLMLSAFSDKQYAVRSLKLGAAGCLSKTADAAQMLAAVRTAMGGGLHIPPDVGAQLDGALERRGRPPLRQRLSPREIEVLRLLASGRSVAEIAAQLELTAHAVAECRAQLMALTGMRNDVELALYAVREAVV